MDAWAAERSDRRSTTEVLDAELERVRRQYVEELRRQQLDADERAADYLVDAARSDAVLGAKMRRWREVQEGVWVAEEVPSDVQAAVVDPTPPLEELFGRTPRIRPQGGGSGSNR